MPSSLASENLRWRSLRTAVAVCALASLTACPRPIRFGPEGELKDPQALIRLLEIREARVRSVKGEARARVATPERSGSLTQLIAAQAPAQLYLESLDFFGKPLAALASDGKRFALFNVEEGAYYTGPATAENLSLLLPVRLQPEEAVAVLLGTLPRIAATEARLEVDEDRRAYLLTLQSDGLRQRLFVGTEDYRPLRSELRGAAGYDIDYGDFQLIGGEIFPTEMTLTAVDAQGKPTGTRVSIDYSDDLELNLALPADLFALPQPPNTRRVELDARGHRVPP